MTQYFLYLIWWATAAGGALQGTGYVLHDGCCMLCRSLNADNDLSVFRSQCGAQFEWTWTTKGGIGNGGKSSATNFDHNVLSRHNWLKVLFMAEVCSAESCVTEESWKIHLKAATKTCVKSRHRFRECHTSFIVRVLRGTWGRACDLWCITWGRALMHHAACYYYSIFPGLRDNQRHNSALIITIKSSTSAQSTNIVTYLK